MPWLRKRNDVQEMLAPIHLFATEPSGKAQGSDKSSKGETKQYKNQNQNRHKKGSGQGDQQKTGQPAPSSAQ